MRRKTILEKTQQAARLLSEARIAYARAFQRNKMVVNANPVTDRLAEQITIEQTGDAAMKAQMDYDILLILLQKEDDPC